MEVFCGKPKWNQYLALKKTSLHIEAILYIVYIFKTLFIYLFIYIYFWNIISIISIIIQSFEKTLSSTSSATTRS
jgi:hypothetical protein